MAAPAIDRTARRANDAWRERRRRATQLADRHPYARDTLRLYARLLVAQENAYARALVDQPVLESLAEYVTQRVAPAVVVAVETAGIAALSAAAWPWLRQRAEADVASWLAGAE